VWTPLEMQVFFWSVWSCDRVQSCVRPLIAAFHTPRARMEIRRSGPYRLRALFGAPSGTGFPNPISSILFPYLPKSFSHFQFTGPAYRRSTVLCCTHRISINLSIGHQCPNNTSCFVSKCHSYKHARFARQHTRKPCPFRSTFSSSLSNN